MKEIDKKVINQLKSECMESPRNRAHYNIHPTLDDPIQRLCISAGKGTYIRPHRHTEEGKFELFIILQGTATIIIFDKDGTVISRSELSEDKTRAVEIPPQEWHTLVVNSQSVLMEFKPGPYAPLSDKDFANWAPEENAPNAKEFEERIRNAKIGDNVCNLK